MFQQAWERALGMVCVTVIAVAFIVVNPMMPTRVIRTGSPIGSKASGNHFVSNQGGTFGQQLNAYGVGFNWQDFASDAVMNASPAGVKGIRWVGGGYTITGECFWDIDDAALTTIVNGLKGNPKFSNIYFITDEPHHDVCPDAPAALAARTALIHSLDPNAKTYSVILDGDNHPGEFAAFKDSVDYIGVDPYPCIIADPVTCDYADMTGLIDTALANIPPSRIVPVFQLFGQTCGGLEYNYYRIPTQAEMNIMLGIWDTKVPKNVRPFDNGYGWSNQTVACPTMVDAIGSNGYPDLQTTMRFYFSR